MEHYAGLDVSVKETSVCVIDGTGKVIQEVKVATEPDTIRAVLVDDTFAIERIGLEAGPLSQWLYSGLAEAGLPVICVETRHMHEQVRGADLRASCGSSGPGSHRRTPVDRPQSVTRAAWRAASSAARYRAPG